MVEWLTEPLSYGFAVKGLLAGLFAAASCAALSAFVVWRGMAFIGDAIAHSILPGVVLAFILGFSLFLGALAAAFVTALGIGVLSRKHTMNRRWQTFGNRCCTSKKSDALIISLSLAGILF